MRQQHLILGTAIIAAGAMFGAMGAEGAAILGVCDDASNGTLPSCTCKSPSGYSIALQSETPAPTQTTYQYKVTGQGNAKVNTINQVQVVVSRPVSTTNQDPSAGKGVILGGDVYLIRDYCTPDPNSGNNKGNCQGFLVHTRVSGATNTQAFINIPVGRNVADGMVTFNIVGGNGNSEQCSAVNAAGQVITPLSGIAGPGDIGDPFQPKFSEQKTTVADGKCLATLRFDKKGTLIGIVDPPINTNGYVPTPNTDEVNCTLVTVPGDINVNGKPLKNNTGPHGMTFGDGTTTCYGPSIPSPAKCVCTKLPCP